jgi:hypothetical protein
MVIRNENNLRQPLLSDVAAAISFIKMRRKDTREKSTVFENIIGNRSKSLSQKFVDSFLSDDAARD